MKKCLFIPLILVFYCGCITKRPQHLLPLTAGPAHKALAIESGTVPVTAAKSALARIVKRAYWEIQRQQVSLQSQGVLEIIHKSIKQEGFKIGVLTPGLASSLTFGVLDCSDLTYVYLEVAHVSGMEMSVAYMPDHILVVLPTPEGNVFWETLAGKELPRQEYIDKEHVPPESVIQGVYLTALPADTALSVAYVELSGVYLAWEQLQKAKQACKSALAIHPTCVNAWSTLGHIAFREEKYQYSEQLWNRVLLLDPDDERAKRHLEKVYVAIAGEK